MQVAEFQLYGRVQSLEAVCLAQSKREALLLSFSDAKVHVVRAQHYTTEFLE